MKKILITGASSGLGLEIGNILCKRGATIVNLSRNSSPFTNIALDLASNASIDTAIKQVREIHDDFDTLILNAGIMPLGLIGEMDFDIDNLFRINIAGSIQIVNGLLDVMKTNNADILIIGSTAALQPYENHAAYCASKYAVQGFIKALQLELKDYNVRVIGFHPGGFNSNLRGGVIKDGYMDPKDLAKLAISLLDLPKSIEVSEIVVKRKKTS